MRVLVVHNRYRSKVPSGENAVVDTDVSMLRRVGVDVDTYFRSSDEIEEMSASTRATLAWRPIYSHRDVAAVEQRLANTRPDVVHLHNPYPLISPWVVRAAHRASVPVVHTVHSYRLVCANGVLYRDGHVCEDCQGKRVPWPAVAHSCYRDSMAQSVAMAAALTLHRPTWRSIDQFLPVSEFVAGYLERYGVPRDRMTVRSNSVPDPGPPAPLGSGFVFVGRLSEEKGIELLLEAWRRAGLGPSVNLTIVGDGPQRELVERATHEMAGVTFVGPLPPADVARAISSSAVVVVPSVCFEGFPRLVAEAFAQGRPVLATSLGSLAELVDNAVGWSVAPTADALVAGLRVATHDETTSTKARVARARYVERYSERRVLADLLDTYNRVIDARR